MLKQVLSPKEIAEAVSGIADSITMIHDPCVWIVMDAGFMFGADLLRKAKGIRSVQFIYVERGYGTVTGPHDPRIYHMSHEPVFLTKYNHVFVDVVVEEGETFGALLKLVPERQLPDTTCCALIRKGDCFGPVVFGKQVDKEPFLTGYGMLPYRNLPYIAERREK